MSDFILSGKLPTRDVLLFLQSLGINYIDFLVVILVFVSCCQCQQYCLHFCCSDPKMFFLVWALWNSYERPLGDLAVRRLETRQRNRESGSIANVNTGNASNFGGMIWLCIIRSIITNIMEALFWKVVRVYGHYPNSFWPYTNKLKVIWIRQTPTSLCTTSNFLI